MDEPQQNPPNSPNAPNSPRARLQELQKIPERQRTDAVLRLAPAEAHNCRIEAELELQDADADPLCRQKVSEFMYEDKHTEYERE